MSVCLASRWSFSPKTLSVYTQNGTLMLNGKKRLQTAADKHNNSSFFPVTENKKIWLKRHLSLISFRVNSEWPDISQRARVQVTWLPILTSLRQLGPGLIDWSDGELGRVMTFLVESCEAECTTTDIILYSVEPCQQYCWTQCEPLLTDSEPHSTIQAPTQMALLLNVPDVFSPSETKTNTVISHSWSFC